MKLTLEQLKSLIREQVELGAKEVRRDPIVKTDPKAPRTQNPIKTGPTVFVLLGLETDGEGQDIVGIFASMSDAETAAAAYKKRRKEEDPSDRMRCFVQRMKIGHWPNPSYTSGGTQLTQV